MPKKTTNGERGSLPARNADRRVPAGPGRLRSSRSDVRGSDEDRGETHASPKPGAGSRPVPRVARAVGGRVCPPVREDGEPIRDRERRPRPACERSLRPGVTRALHVLVRHAETRRSARVSHHAGTVDAKRGVDLHGDARRTIAALRLAARGAALTALTLPRRPGVRRELQRATDETVTRV
jgi:hypothetical protein